MRLFLMVLALVTATSGCTGPRPAQPTPAEPEPAAAPSKVLPVSSAEEIAAAPWRSVWPVDGGGATTASAAGRLLGSAGSLPGAPAGSCGGLTRLEGSGVLWLPEGETITFGNAPVVAAALVERAAWRLDEVGEAGTAILPGVEAPDPALHRGIRVRSVRKIRRQGAPFQLVLGERGDQVLIALTDRDADTRLDGLALHRRDASPLTWGVLPAADLDGDGSLEIVVYGDGAQGGFRAVLGLEPVDGGLTLRTFEESGPVTCSG